MVLPPRQVPFTASVSCLVTDCLQNAKGWYLPLVSRMGQVSLFM